MIPTNNSAKISSSTGWIIQCTDFKRLNPNLKETEVDLKKEICESRSVTYGVAFHIKLKNVKLRMNIELSFNPFTAINASLSK